MKLVQKAPPAHQEPLVKQGEVENLGCLAYQVIPEDLVRRETRVILVSQVLRGVRGYLVNREGQDCLEKMGIRERLVLLGIPDALVEWDFPEKRANLDHLVQLVHVEEQENLEH